MDTREIHIVIAFGVYLAAMLSIGVFFYRRTDSIADYVLGDRRLNKWVTSLSAQASDMSGWLLMGLPGAAYLGGLSASWIALGLLLGTYVNWRFVAARWPVLSWVDSLFSPGDSSREESLAFTRSYLDFCSLRLPSSWSAGRANRPEAKYVRNSTHCPKEIRLNCFQYANNA